MGSTATIGTSQVVLSTSSASDQAWVDGPPHRRAGHLALSRYISNDTIVDRFRSLVARSVTAVRDRHDLGPMREAGIALIDLYREVASTLAASHGIEDPTELDRLLSDRLRGLW